MFRNIANQREREKKNPHVSFDKKDVLFKGSLGVSRGFPRDGGIYSYEFKTAMSLKF